MMQSYKQMKFSVASEIAEEFKTKCEVAGISMASEISRFMSGQKSSRNQIKPFSKVLQKQDLKTRQLRRKAVTALIQQTEAILDAELQYKDNIPINLQNASNYEAAEQAVSALEEVLNNLYEVYQ